MQIWVDADACPKVIKEILFRVAERTKTIVTLIANQLLYTPSSVYIKKLQVPGGFDVADNEIVVRVVAGDLVITADIPLAYAVIGKGAKALNPRGELYTEANIKQRLSFRDFNENLRGCGVSIGGPASLSKKEIQAFANCLDQFLSHQK